MSWKLNSLALAPWHCVTGLWIDCSQCSRRSNRFQISFQLCHFVCYDVSVMFKECLYWRYSPKKCRWHMSDNFQFPLKGTTIYKTSRHSLLGALDTASISLMDWLSYSDSAVLLSLYRRLCAPDCALQAVVFLPYRYTAVSGLLV